MPPLGLGPNKGPAFGHEFADAYLAQVGETLGFLDLADDAGGTTPLPSGAPRAHTSTLSAQWRAGPLDPAGTVVDLSARPLLCCDLTPDGGTAVVGGADHGLKEVMLGREPRVRRELFTRTDGHREWVSCVRALPDGRVLSGGVDAKLCLWAASVRPVRCTDLAGHTGSVAALALSETAAVALSASYDKTVRAWDLSRGGSSIGTLRAHRAPVMHLVWQGGLLASGDRSGEAVVWDLQTGQPKRAPFAAHRGHVTAMDAASPGDGAAGSAGTLLVSGGHDGCIRVWDVRVGGGRPTAAGGGGAERHVLEAKGAHTGAVNELKWHTLPSGAQLLVSAGADKRLCLFDPRRSLQLVRECTEHRDHIYSLACHGGYAFSGGGDGMLLAHDLPTGDCLYGLGANRAAVRCIHATAPGSLVAAGDDGGLMVYRFEHEGSDQGVGPHAVLGRDRPQLPPHAAAGPALPAASRRLSRDGAPTPSAMDVAPLRGTAAAASQSARAYAEKRREALERAAMLRDQRRTQAGLARGGAGSASGGSDELAGGFGRPFVAGCGGAPQNRGRASGVGTGGQQWQALERGDARASGPGEASQRQEPMSELDMLHAAGDAKFGRPRRRL